MRICSECGAKNLDDALYCGKCGNDLMSAVGKDTKKEAWNSLLTPPTNYVPRSGGLFKNAGPKLKVLAKVIFVISLIIGEILGIVAIVAGADSWNGEILITVGVILIIISPLLAWLSAIMLYAFGELCENVNDIRYYASQSKQK